MRFRRFVFVMGVIMLAAGISSLFLGGREGFGIAMTVTGAVFMFYGGRAFR